MFIAALFIVNKIGKQVSFNGWTDKEIIYTHTHTHNGILFNHKNKKILQFVTTLMDPEDIKLGEMSEKEKCCMISLTCGI